MKITPLNQSNTYYFMVEFDNKKYRATIYLNDSSSKFQDWQVTDMKDNVIVGELEDKIIEEIDMQWNRLVG